MDLRLQGKTALVTGASQGIGEESARILAAEGCNLILVSRTASKLEELANSIKQEFNNDVQTIAADLSLEDERQKVAAAVKNIDILVNNAGAIPPGSLQDISDERWKEAWDLKVFGYISLTRALYAALKERQGVIVNVIGAAGESFNPDYIAGSAGNASLMAFTKAMGKAAAKDGLRIVGINPGPVSTPRNETMLRARAQTELGDANKWTELNADLAYGRAATPEEIGSAVAFLASPLSGYTNGAILTINGGL